MMKKFIKLSTLTLIGFLILFISSPAMFADSTGDSKATIEFKIDVAPPILDPTDPSDPYDPDPEDPTDPQDPPTGNTGALTLDYVSSVHFGEHKIDGTTNTVFESTVLRPFIQVSDRRGTAAGWTVTAQATEFSNTENTPTLEGSILTFTNGSVISPNSSLTPPSPSGEIILNAGGDAAIVVSAAENTGIGTWITRWFPSEEAELNDNVTLTIPAGTASEGKHEATITWTLTDAPGQ